MNISRIAARIMGKGEHLSKSHAFHFHPFLPYTVRLSLKSAVKRDQKRKPQLLFAASDFQLGHSSLPLSSRPPILFVYYFHLPSSYCTT